MKENRQNVIIKVLPDSIGEEIGIEAGDVLVGINEQPVQDVFDYRYLISDEYIELHIKKPDGEEWIAEIEKEIEEDLGIVFESGLMDHAKSCRNQCVFCFIDQLPPNMRDTLYFKDDDSRLSFLQGNYVTLTNMSEADIERIIYYHLSPINISVHTTDPKLREKMLKNRFAGKVIGYMKRFAEANIEMNCQVVLCKGINDKEHLDKTIDDLSTFIPHVKSLSVVPVGISNHRENLHPLEPFYKEDAAQVIAQIHTWQNRFKADHDTGFVYAADEFYLKAEEPIPSYRRYEDFPQIENGVGMIAMMEREFTECLKGLQGDQKNRELSIVTGKAAYDFMMSLSNRLCERFPNTNIHIYPIENRFFGEHITVVGLLTGQDVMEQLEGRKLGSALLIPQSMLRAQDTVLLDDVEVKEIEERFQVPIKVVESSGQALIQAILSTEEDGQ